MRILLFITTVVFLPLSAFGFLTLSWLVGMHKMAGKKMDETDKRDIISISLMLLLMGVVSYSLLLYQDVTIEKKMKNATEGLTEVTSYYDYANNKLVTTDRLNEKYDDNCERTMYISDSGKVYIVAVNSESIFTPEVTKTEVKSFEKTPESDIEEDYE